MADCNVHNDGDKPVFGRVVKCTSGRAAFVHWHRGTGTVLICFFCAVNPEKSGRKMALLSDFRTDLTLFRRGEYDILLFALAKIFKVRVAIRSWF
jgi:hypothetical protein